jgi:2-keto-4-pentenoate hydratase/2-oxohepta-3-ene-1,7-dioic acid hydratase in catechol pathway
MPLVNFSHGGRSRLGKLFGDHLIDLSVAAPDLPDTVIGFLAAGDTALASFRAVDDRTDARIAIADVRLLPPVPRPEKFLGIGMNYRDHAAEASKAGLETPPYQLWFNKQVSCITGPFDDVVKPNVSEKLDYEAELAVVIGRSCRHVTVADARSVIGGYMVSNDVSARDWQMRTPTHTLGKSFDTHGPIGPWLVLDSEIENPHALEIRMFVNGEQRQRGSTGSMIHNIFEQISYLSTVMTLKPGDILATGTPSGVGAALNPPRFLKPGDVMRVEIDGIGHIENPIVAERA